jgi:hypothetical protein
LGLSWVAGFGALFAGFGVAAWVALIVGRRALGTEQEFVEQLPFECAGYPQFLLGDDDRLHLRFEFAGVPPKPDVLFDELNGLDENVVVRSVEYHPHSFVLQHKKAALVVVGTETVGDVEPPRRPVRSWLFQWFHRACAEVLLPLHREHLLKSVRME